MEIFLIRDMCKLMLCLLLEMFYPTGKIVHYGRAELKQSDHRPVLAIIDVEGCTVLDSKLTNTYESVVASLGPSDCTVVVQVCYYNFKKFLLVFQPWFFVDLYQNCVTYGGI